VLEKTIYALSTHKKPFFAHISLLEKNIILERTEEMIKKKQGCTSALSS
jgi:hypothetical protein